MNTTRSPGTLGRVSLCHALPIWTIFLIILADCSLTETANFTGSIVVSEFFDYLYAVQL